MDDNVKEKLTVVLEMLKGTLVRNGVSMGSDGEGNILFFDTDTYINTGRMNGFSVNINNLTG